MKRLIIQALFLLLLFPFTVASQELENMPKKWDNPGIYDSLVLSNMTINSKYDEYAPLIMAGDVLYFTSNRRNKEGDKALLAFNEKIYFTTPIDTFWKKPSAFYFFNSDDQSALAGVSYTAEKMFIYKTFGNGDLYVSQKIKGKWSKPKRLKSPINSSFHEQSISEENGIMVVSSDRNTIDGSHDIFWARKNAEGMYKNFSPLNMANTDSDEVDVRLSKDGNKLYFASDRDGTIGGFDIFVCTLDEDGQWSSPVPLKYPVNTKSNDRNFIDCDSAFFLASEREQGKGGDDIFWGHIVRRIPEKIDDSVVTEIVISEPDTNRFVIMERKLDSAGIKQYYARVQIGAYYNRSVEEFKKYYPGLKNRDIYIEKVIWHNGRLIHKFIINKVFTTIKEAAEVQREMWTVHGITDAFVAIYTMEHERVAIYNTIIGQFVILKGDQKPFYF